MSVLAWLFGLGAAAVVFPILFHLIRRTPQGQTEFSSLMFLKASPPALTRRSRLDNLWLLLLRAAAIGLLALAFMRPFFRGNSELAQFDVAHRQVAILLDVSASMRRAGVWEAAKKSILETLDQLESGDQVALFTFDTKLDAVVPFPDPDSESGTALESNADEIEAIKAALIELEPGWAHSDLGTAMVAVSGQLGRWQDESRNDQAAQQAKLQMYIVSDMQSGSAIDSLQRYQWPSLVKVDFKSVAPQTSHNASVELLSQVIQQKQPTLRVRVTNWSSKVDTAQEAFTVSWADRWLAKTRPRQENPADETDQADDQLSFVVRPGESRVLELPLEKAIHANSFLLKGDQDGFDNSFFVAPPAAQQLSILYLGSDDADDPEGALFYLARAFSKTPTRSFLVSQFPDRLDAKAGARSNLSAWLKSGELTPISRNGERIKNPATLEWDSQASPTLVILNRSVNASELEVLRQWVSNGVNLLVCVADSSVRDSVKALVGADRKVASTSPSSTAEAYVMLADFDFKDPVFQPFADPNFSDFTSIRFWQHQDLELDETCQVLACFDNRSPAVWRKSIDRGNVIGLATSWRPADSQFALSPKFIAFMASLVEWSADAPPVLASTTVGQPIRLPPCNQDCIVVKPNGSTDVISAGDGVFRNTWQPGVYRISKELDENNDVIDDDSECDWLNRAVVFAVNVDRRESIADPIGLEQLERLGVQLGVQTAAETELAQLRELRDRELESQQKVWKWLIVAAIVVLIVETFYAGYRARSSSPSSSDSLGDDSGNEGVQAGSVEQNVVTT